MHSGPWCLAEALPAPVTEGPSQHPSRGLYGLGLSTRKGLVQTGRVQEGEQEEGRCGQRAVVERARR